MLPSEPGGFCCGLSDPYSSNYQHIHILCVCNHLHTSDANTSTPALICWHQALKEKSITLEATVCCDMQTDTTRPLQRPAQIKAA